MRNPGGNLTLVYCASPCPLSSGAPRSSYGHAADGETVVTRLGAAEPLARRPMPRVVRAKWVQVESCRAPSRGCVARTNRLRSDELAPAKSTPTNLAQPARTQAGVGSQLKVSPPRTRSPVCAEIGTLHEEPPS